MLSGASNTLLGAEAFVDFKKWLLFHENHKVSFNLCQPWKN